MDRDEKYFELLLSEKQLADSQIGGYADLNVRVFGLFGVGVVLLGWLYSGGGSSTGGVEALPVSTGLVCLALAVISCGIIVQGVTTYALALGYIQYKNEVLNVELRRLLERPDFPLKAVSAWQTGAARRPTMLSSAFLFLLHKLVSAALLVIAAYSFPPVLWARLAVTLAWFIWVMNIFVELTLLRSIARVLMHRAP